MPVRFLKFKSTDEGNPFQFHDFFQIYSLHFRVQTSAVQRFHEKTKQSTHARPLAPDKTKNTGARLRNFYKISIGTIYYKNIETFHLLIIFHQVNISQQFQKVFALSHEEEHQSTLTKKTNELSKYVVKFDCDIDLWSKICRYVFKK